MKKGLFPPPDYFNVMLQILSKIVKIIGPSLTSTKFLLSA